MDIKTYTQDQVDLKLLATDMASVKKMVGDINNKLDANYVTKDAMKLMEQKLDLIQKIVYGVIALILTAVVGAVVSLVLR